MHEALRYTYIMHTLFLFLSCILYSVESTPRAGAAFGEGTGPILFDYVRCNGREDRLFDCTNSGIEVISGSCGHHRDAGVMCTSGENMCNSQVIMRAIMIHCHS